MSVLELALVWPEIFVLTVKRTSTQHDHENVLIVLLDTQSATTFSHTQKRLKSLQQNIDINMDNREEQAKRHWTHNKTAQLRPVTVTCVLTWILKPCLYTNTWCKNVAKWMHNWININREFNASTVWTISDLWCFLVTVDTIDRYWLVQRSLVQTRP